MSEVVLDVRGLARRYGEAAVFQGVDLQVSRGEFVAILGESGVGKSTLLNCIAGLDRPDAGEVRVLGFDITHADEAQQAHWRRRHLGFVFQAFHVLPHLTVAQNVALPLMLLGEPDDGRVEQALRSVGLAGLGSRLPQQLSGGQVQRVAIARALIHRPALLLADEPTGNLDPGSARQVLQALREQTREHGAACVLVTHSRAAAGVADRVMELTVSGMNDVARAPH
ncbi:ABC transporter ATP-binding protein [Caldimonas thermodepolymerans]|jgi:ABC-type antimicrobial peptide transport system, ATPase component|uniref:ABC transport system ATP-binding protein n=1 Tax=Caldimonas thermodepolymerans TaxID=215580 RepID=A0A2S5T2S0_9BURK|nr:ABC transporter ATP-binding protein [Caldimonas thermodepolymerans]PPE69242.1 ABC transporter ATP-binding protein [Caldimonas thermodepolymerans]QPC32852.1 ABC transporter ATP-binding protein [Caldimonas thermodepolymerans]RDI03627.1 putative ABC transport system ATP-binding protein [Caldimonas thermodepolymerans]TCP09596.1 putative ABC transport system ATP-binding protein [Caldimonas thermodepolymerans]UZG45721.1 ABC transporter ATP-binding protein [Caldimonas thermodepolymerans]